MFPRHNRPFYQPKNQMNRTPYAPQRHAFQPRFPGLPYNANNDNDYDFWCETCDRGFKSASLLEKHTNEHEICNIDGCKFVAHPKVITKHIQMQHSTGLFKKIANLNDPEEIRKWREERKNKFPTKLNISKKAAEKTEKIERGEKMSLCNKQMNRRDMQNISSADYGGKRNYPRSQINNANNRGEPRNKVQKRNKTRRQPNEVPVAEEKYRLKEFTGIQAIVEDSDSGKDIESQEEEAFEIYDEDDFTNGPDKTIDKNVLCGALTTIIGNYGSSDEEECNYELSNSKLEKVHSEVAKKPEVQDIINVDDTVKDSICDDDSGPEEVSNVKHEIKSNESNITKKMLDATTTRKDISHHKQQRPKQIPRRAMPKPPSTLLRKLLHREVQHERNIILQCVRHIVKNNYFEK